MAFLLVAPLPASRLFSREGERAQTYAWKEETVKTPKRFSVCFVDWVTWVSTPWKREEKGVKVFCSKACPNHRCPLVGGPNTVDFVHRTRKT